MYVLLEILVTKYTTDKSSPCLFGKRQILTNTSMKRREIIIITISGM